MSIFASSSAFSSCYSSSCTLPQFIYSQQHSFIKTLLWLLQLHHPRPPTLLNCPPCSVASFNNLDTKSSVCCLSRFSSIGISHIKHSLKQFEIICIISCLFLNYPSNDSQNIHIITGPSSTIKAFDGTDLSRRLLYPHQVGVFRLLHAGKKLNPNVWKNGHSFCFPMCRKIVFQHYNSSSYCLRYLLLKPCKTSKKLVFPHPGFLIEMVVKPQLGPCFVLK